MRLIRTMTVMGLGALLLVVAAAPHPAPPAGTTDVVWTVLLVGDAGAPADDDPVLAALARAAAERPERTTVLFLGDNIYPRGLPPRDARDRAEMARRLRRQVEAGTAGGARAVFVPGNHDWDNARAGGWDAIRRQAEAVRALSGGQAELLPADGCPGPEIRDVGDSFRLVLLDTHWWLHRHAKPGSTGCAPGVEDEIGPALSAAVRDAGGRHVIVAGHHPLRSGGDHGALAGFFRRLFPPEQDLAGRRYRALVGALEEAMRRTPPLVYAAGHDHGLQVLAGASARWLLVSAAGNAGRAARVARLDSTRYAARADGFLRLDALADGDVRLTVVEVRNGTPAVAFTLSLLRE
jgi:hypothetical protein